MDCFVASLLAMTRRLDRRELYRRPFVAFIRKYVLIEVARSVRAAQSPLSRARIPRRMRRYRVREISAIAADGFFALWPLMT